MRKGLLILGLSTLGIFLGVKLSQAAKTAQNIYSKIKYTFSNIGLKISHAIIYLSADINITNLSNMTINITNLMVLVQYKKNNSYSDLAYTKQSIPLIVIKANNTTKVSGLTMEVGLGLAAYNLLLALGGSITELKIITTFYFQGFEQKLEQIVPIKAQQVSGVNGIEDGLLLKLVTPLENPVAHGLWDEEKFQKMVV
jgi:hypothetical protein